MDAEKEMQEYSESHMGRGRKIVSRAFSYTFRFFVYGIIAIILWRVLFSGIVPGKAKVLSVNETTYAAYLAQGDSLTMYTQTQEQLAIEEREEITLGLFWVCDTVFIPDADQIQVLARYNNSTLRHVATDFKLGAIPSRSEDIMDLTLLVVTDPTPEDTENGDEYQTRYHASGNPRQARSSMYNYRRFVFDGIKVDRTTVSITAQFYYIGRVDYNGLPYSQLLIYDSETENEELHLRGRDRRALRAFASNQ